MLLEPFAYHRTVADYLEREESGLWNWFLSDNASERFQKSMRLELLKSSGRLDRVQSASEYALAHTARDALELDAKVVLYKVIGTGDAPNAFLYYLPGEINVALSGRIVELLTTDELLAILGHEIAHYKLYQEDDGRYFNATRMLRWIDRQQDCPAVFRETVRRFNLYMEIYADIGAYAVCKERDPVITALVKSISDYKDAEAAAYLKQVEEIFELDSSTSKDSTHPELFIRARAIANHEAMAASEFEASLKPLIEGPVGVEETDLIEQEALRDLTRRLWDCFANISSARPESVLAHARQYFADYSWPSDSAVPSIEVNVEAMAPSTVDYLSYALLDMATCDRESREQGLSTALAVASDVGLSDTFRAIAKKELKKSAAELKRLELAATERNGGDIHA